MNYKHIHIGHIIKEQVAQQELRMTRLCKFFKVTEEEVIMMYKQKSLDADILIKWSKLLKQNLFLYYHYHLILHSQIGAAPRLDKSTSPFPRNFYTIELQNFFVDLVIKKGMNPTEVRHRYKIPKPTFYRWLQKAGYTENLSEPRTVEESQVLLPMESKTPLEYKVIFEDIARERFGAAIPKEIAQKLQQLDSLKAVQECNDLIFRRPRNLRHNEYPRQFIERVLEIQREGNLSNAKVAERFCIGSTTVGQWKREYQNNNNS